MCSWRSITSLNLLPRYILFLSQLEDLPLYHPDRQFDGTSMRCACELFALLVVEFVCSSLETEWSITLSKHRQDLLQELQSAGDSAEAKQFEGAI